MVDSLNTLTWESNQIKMETFTWYSSVALLSPTCFELLNTNADLYCQDIVNIQTQILIYTAPAIVNIQAQILIYTNTLTVIIQTQLQIYTYTDNVNIQIQILINNDIDISNIQTQMLIYTVKGQNLVVPARGYFSEFILLILLSH